MPSLNSLYMPYEKPDWLSDFDKEVTGSFFERMPMFQRNPYGETNYYRVVAQDMGLIPEDEIPVGSQRSEMPQDNVSLAPYIGAAAAGVGLLADAYNTSNSYARNTFKAQPVSVPTSQQGLARLSEVEPMPTRTRYDFGASDFFRCGGRLGRKYGHGGYWMDALSGAASGAAAGAVLGPWGALAGGVIGLGSSIVGNEIKNTNAARESELYNMERQEQEANRAYALGLGARQVGLNRNSFFNRSYVHDDGGVLHGVMSGGNGVTEIENGGTHERNPLGGVPMGIAPDGLPNLVEEGEVKWDKENYIFSNRLKPTKRILKDNVLTDKRWEGKTYAEIAKSIQSASEERENDPVATQTVDEMLGRLMSAQETTRMEKQAKEIQKMIASMPPEELAQIMGAAPESMPQGMPPMPPQGMPMQMEPQGMEAAGAGLGQEPVMGEPLQQTMEQPMMAYGGHLFAKGGSPDIPPSQRARLNELLAQQYMAENYNYNNAYQSALKDAEALTDEEALEWSKKHNIKFNPQNVATNTERDAINNAIVNYYISNYDKGLQDRDDILDFFSKKSDDEVIEFAKKHNIPIPSLGNNYLTFDFTHGGWGSENGAAWNGSTDAAWIEALALAAKDNINLTEQNANTVADYIRKTKAYQQGTEWLQKDEENRRRYLASIVQSKDAPAAAKNFAKRFVNDKGEWKDGAKRDYESIYGRVRATHPGTYWKTPNEIIAEMTTPAEQNAPKTPVEDPKTGVRYYIRNGNNYELIGPQDVYNNWVLSHAQYTSPYQFREANENGVKYTDYFVQAPEAPAEKIPFPEYSPWPGVANAGIALAGAWNTPDYEKANIIDTYRPVPVDYTPIGNYLAYDPMDIDYMTNVLRGQSAGTRAAVNNRISPSVGAEQLAADYNAALALGNAYEQARQYNQKERQAVAEFNRGTDQFNAGAANQAEQTNFGLNGLNWERTKAYADARDAASSIASQANSAAVTSAMQNLSEAYKDWYNTQGLGWLVQNNVYPGVEYKKKKA